MPQREFLKAKWHNLLMLNYEVDPAALQAYIPPGTVLDTWQGKTLVSMVGFLFRETRMLGIRWPFHINFEEVNLRFYVRYFTGSEWKRGAVFISELVPKRMIALVANTFYNEHYMVMPMHHSITPINAQHTNFLYEWKYKGKWNQLGATVNNALHPITPGSIEEFIFEHYWGYNKIGPNKTIEYQVEHVSWQTGQVTNFVFDANIAALYGKPFESFLKAQPHSMLFANGSDIVVRAGSKFSI